MHQHRARRNRHPYLEGLAFRGAVSPSVLPPAQGGRLRSHLCNTEAEDGAGNLAGDLTAAAPFSGTHVRLTTPLAPPALGGVRGVLFYSSLAPVYERTEGSSLWALGASRDGDGATP